MEVLLYTAIMKFIPCDAARRTRDVVLALLVVVPSPITKSISLAPPK